MDKILVSGGAGFIGSHLCDFLLKKGYYVYCLDNFSTGKKENICHLMNHDNFNLIEHDIVDPIDVEVDKIFNLSCPASPEQYQKNPIKTMKTSILGIYNLIDLSLKYNAHLIHASTSEVYGDPLEHPQKESYWGNVNPVGIRSCYDEGKRCSETIVMDYIRKENLSASIVRIFNTYGPHMLKNDGRVVSNFIVSALLDNNIIINGDGMQTRSFCYISDLLSAFEKILDKEYVGPINIGNPNEITILELCQLIIELTNSNSKFIFSKLPKDDPLKRKPDISLAQKELNWHPEINLREGLMKTICFFKEEKYESDSTEN